MNTTSSTDFSELDRFQHLPKTIQDYLGSLELVQLIERMVQTFKLDTSHKRRFQDYIEKVFFKDLPLMQSVAYLKNEVLPAEADAQAFFDELTKAGMFRFTEYFKTSGPLESVLKPSAEDVRLRTGIDFRSPPLPQPKLEVKAVSPTLPSENFSPNPPHPPRLIHLLKEFEPHVEQGRLTKRLHHIAQAFLKDIRDASETEHYLERSSKIGGLGLKIPMVEKIMKVLKKEKDALVQTARQRLDTKKMEEQAPSFFPNDQETWPMNSEIPEAFLTPTPKPKSVSRPSIDVMPSSPSLPPKPKLPQLATATAIMPASPSASPAAAQTKIAVTETPRVPAPLLPNKLLPPKPASGPKPIPRVRRTPLTSDRPVMVDIKHPKEVMGPIDELRRLTLHDFRDVAATAKGRCEKILEKILILEQESVTKKVEGIQAWKASEVNQCYVELGKASLLGDRHVRDVIQERSDRHQPTLTEEEFTAIADLNHQLRF